MKHARLRGHEDLSNFRVFAMMQPSEPSVFLSYQKIHASNAAGRKS